MAAINNEQNRDVEDWAEEPDEVSTLHFCCK